VYHCKQCFPAVKLWRKTVGYSIVPIGPHSLMNGIGWSSSNGATITSAEATHLADQMNALFDHQRSLEELVVMRVLEAARRLGFRGHAVLVRDYLEGRRLAGSTAESGFAELVAAYSTGDTSALAADIWRATAGDRPKFDPESIVVRKLA